MSRPALLVDGDLVAHVICEVHTTSEPTDETGDRWHYETDVKAAYSHFMDHVSDTRKEHGADEVIVAFSEQPNWRLAVLPSYKSNRKSAKKPPGFSALKMRLKHRDVLSIVSKPGLEGDDVLGILATERRGILEAKERIVWSNDKDMRGVPCLLLNSTGFIQTITEEEADHWHLMQTLMGDVTDGYKGCPGIGPVSAEKILSGCSSPWQAVVKAYEKAGLTEDDALVQARVARILRASDYNFDTKEPILWTPS